MDRNGDERWHTFSTSMDGTAAVDLTPATGEFATLVAVSPERPDVALLEVMDRRTHAIEYHWVNISNGVSQATARPPAFRTVIADGKLALRVGQRPTRGGGFDLFRSTPGGGWERFARFGLDDAVSSRPLSIAGDSDLLYLYDSRGRDKAALVAHDLRSGEQTTVAASDRSDIAGILVHPETFEVQAYATFYARMAWHVLEESMRSDLRFLSGAGRGDLHVVSRSADDARWIVAYTRDDGPTVFHLYDRRSGTLRKLFTRRPELETAALAPLRPVVIRARDDLELVSYLTLPLGSDPDGDGSPSHPLPLVLLVHGGPWNRDVFGNNKYHQWLANRGYAALSVNFRGSTGFGKQFVNAGNLEWGRKMQDDLRDAVSWAVETGIADPRHLAIMGGSYGGYAVLVALTSDPEAFACGIDMMGPTNLETLYAFLPDTEFEMWAARVGDPRTDEGLKLLRERSPLHRAERISRPLLIAQGFNDPRVHWTESDQIVQAMLEKGRDVTYVEYADEGHGFAKPESLISFAAIAESFLARCLGGRSEPIGSDIDDANFEVSVGADRIPGLPEALAARSPGGAPR